ncbi:unnamed protein product [Tuber melanosporum]|uniref:(Perigord truffle) hypothetical protein n=1 Tax=Tuber melanosporum (strain Mel28) TaxID=656061 RepID=D5GAJ1_TUBMM|nr:uncharacterized protein GSTUM_00003610001 [Tuber melanosporum]CAZ81534.1 unnamed protein product [Tuber melanosporum]
MSINWVMLSPTPPHTFIALPNERSLYQSPARTGISLTTTSPHRGTRPLSINSNTGTAYITNQRIIYIPTAKTSDFESFACPIANLHDTHVAPPFFGPNVWKAVVQPVANGGLGGGDRGGVELKLIFKDGGAFDFSTIFERLKEKVLNARETGVSAEAVHLDELPTYEDARTGQPSSSVTTAGAPPSPAATAPAMVSEPPEITVIQADADPSIPSGPPPGYEEAQRESVAEELERQIGQIADARIQ